MQLERENVQRDLLYQRQVVRIIRGRIGHRQVYFPARICKVPVERNEETPLIYDMGIWLF